jgi:hypothetical protein
MIIFEPSKVINIGGDQQIRMEKGVGMLGLFLPNGVWQDFDMAGMKIADQLLEALAVAKTSKWNI